MNDNVKHFSYKINSNIVAKKLLEKLTNFSSDLDNKKRLTPSEKRHNLKIKTILALKDN